MVFRVRGPCRSLAAAVLGATLAIAAVGGAAAYTPIVPALAARPDAPLGHVAYRFIKSNPVSMFYTGAITVPARPEPQPPWLQAR